jgi:hypothetical protein
MRPAIALLAAAALLLESGAGAVPTQPTTPSALAPLAAEGAAYGRWFASIAEIEQPVQAANAGMQGSLQALLHSSNPAREVAALRVHITQLLATIDAAQARLEQVEPPTLVLMNLPEDLRPPAVMRGVHDLNQQMRDGWASEMRVLDAILRHDMRAALESSAQTIAAMQRMLDFQLLLARASRALIPADQGIWNMLGVPVAYSQAASQLAHFFPRQPSATFSGTQAARALLALAEDTERNIAEGRARILSETEQTNNMLQGAMRAHDGSAVAIVQRRLNVLATAGDFFGAGDSLVAILRHQAAALNGHPVSQQMLMTIFAELYPVRDRLGEITMALARVNSGS